MERASGAGFLTREQLETVKSLMDDGNNECRITFGANGKVTIEAVKVVSTPGLKLSNQQLDVSVPEKIPLKQRKVGIAAEKDTVTVREKVFEKLKSVGNNLKDKFQSKLHKVKDNLKQFEASVSTKLKSSISDIKKAIKHENWEKIPEDSVKDASDQLQLEAQVHNDSIDQLEVLETQEAERQAELDTLNQVYKNTYKVCEDPESVIQSKKKITVPIPVEGAEPVIIDSPDPVTRREQVNKVISEVGHSDLADRLDQLDAELLQARTGQEQLKASLKESGDRILELFKAEQHTLEQGRDRDARLSELQDTLTEQRIALDDQVDQLQAEIRALKKEKQQTQEYVAEQKKYLSEFKRELSLLSKIPKDREGIQQAYNATVTNIQRTQEFIEMGSARLKALPGEIKEKKAELEPKIKAVDSLEKGEELKKQEKADNREVEAEQNKLKQQLGKNLRKK